MIAIVRKIVEVVLLASLFNSIAAARRLLGSSFGAPGNATYDYIVVGRSSAPYAIQQRRVNARRWWNGRSGTCN